MDGSVILMIVCLIALVIANIYVLWRAKLKRKFILELKRSGRFLLMWFALILVIYFIIIAIIPLETIVAWVNNHITDKASTLDWYLAKGTPIVYIVIVCVIFCLVIWNLEKFASIIKYNEKEKALLKREYEEKKRKIEAKYSNKIIRNIMLGLQTSKDFEK